MTTYNQHQSEDSKATRDSTVVQFYDRCRKSAGKSLPWHMLPTQHQLMFTQAVDVIHQIIYQGE